MQILAHNPFIDELVMMDNADERWAGRTYNWLLKHIEAEGEEFDYVFNLDNTLERGMIAMEDMGEYYRNNEFRRNKYGYTNYYDVATEKCELNDLGTTGDIHFSPEEEHHVFQYAEKYADKQKIMINLSGSSQQKVFVEWKQVCKNILDEYHNAIIWITGDHDCEKEFLNSEYKEDRRFRLVAGKWGFRQAVCFLRYVDLLISPESGIAVAGNAFNRPTIQMLTTSSHINHPKYAKNDYSIQSSAKCSPCHRGPYLFIGCPKKDNLPLCTHFKSEVIMDQVRKALKNERVTV